LPTLSDPTTLDQALDLMQFAGPSTSILLSQIELNTTPKRIE